MVLVSSGERTNGTGMLRRKDCPVPRFLISKREFAFVNTNGLLPVFFRLNIIKHLSPKIHTAFGNHDASPALVTQYLEYFMLAKTYYSFDFENIHFVTIDTNAPLDFNSEQFKFVKTDLEKASSNKSIN